MMPADLPACLVCGGRDYNPGGGSLGAGLCQQNFSCKECRAQVEYVGLDRGNILMFNPTPDHYEYVNRVLMTVWRAWSDEAEKARSIIRHQHLREVNRVLGLPPDTNGSTIGDARYSEWARALDFREREDWKAISYPVGMKEPGLPQMPDDLLACMRLRGGTWSPRVDPMYTKRMEIPADPVRVRHEARFLEIFERVRVATGLEAEREEIPNEYYDDKYQHEPWYRFGVGDGLVTVGPRKRVIAIRGNRVQPFDVCALRNAAKSDGVSWWNGDGWQNDEDVAKSCEIHAYGTDKAVEYLTLLIKSMQR